MIPFCSSSSGGLQERAMVVESTANPEGFTGGPDGAERKT